jgi:hypothetical protein
MSAARYRERHVISGAKSDRADAQVLAEIVRLDRAHHRPIAGDGPAAEGLKLVARSHQAFIWDRTRHLQPLRSALRAFFPRRPGGLSRAQQPRGAGTARASAGPGPGGPAVEVEADRGPDPGPPA